MNYESAAKSLLLILASLSFNHGLTSPTPHTTKGLSFVYRGQLFETTVFIWALCARIIIFSLTALHIATSLQFDLPGAENASGRLLFNAVCPNPSSNFANRLQSFSFPFILGVSGMILGGMLRAWCYATLGDLFTYLVTISPNHKLITSGPYAYVRHPSYTGVFLLLVSAIFTHFISSGSFLTECGLMNSTIWKWFFRWWMMVAVFSLFSLRKRGKVEDTVMKKTFGEEWIVYRKAVPYAFIPFVL